jgi:dolichol-phosphate mannosyltransferase
VSAPKELERLSTLVEEIDRALQNHRYELIVVGADPERTGTIVEGLSHRYPIKGVYKTESGAAPTIIEGFKHATGQVLGVADADLHHPAQITSELLGRIESGSDIAIASRYVQGGGVRDWSFARRAVSKATTLLARYSLPSVRKVRDPLSRFFLVRREIVDDIKLSPTNDRILLEIVARGSIDSVAEIPYSATPRESGEATLNVREQAVYLQHVIKLATRQRGYWRFLQFSLVGGTGTGVNLGVYALLTSVIGTSHGIGITWGFEVSVLSNFILNDLWTFSDRRSSNLRDTLVRLVKFNLISLGVYGIYRGIFHLLYYELDMNNYVAYSIAIVIGTIWNFGLNVIWTYRKRATEDSQAEAPLA